MAIVIAKHKRYSIKEIKKYSLLDRTTKKYFEDFYCLNIYLANKDGVIFTKCCYPNRLVNFHKAGIRIFK